MRMQDFLSIYDKQKLFLGFPEKKERANEHIGKNISWKRVISFP